MEEVTLYFSDKSIALISLAIARDLNYERFLRCYLGLAENVVKKFAKERENKIMFFVKDSIHYWTSCNKKTIEECDNKSEFDTFMYVCRKAAANEHIDENTLERINSIHKNAKDENDLSLQPKSCEDSQKKKSVKPNIDVINKIGQCLPLDCIEMMAEIDLSY